MPKMFSWNFNQQGQAQEAKLELTSSNPFKQEARFIKTQTANYSCRTYATFVFVHYINEHNENNILAYGGLSNRLVSSVGLINYS